MKTGHINMSTMVSKIETRIRLREDMKTSVVLKMSGIANGTQFSINGVAVGESLNINFG